MLACYFVFFGYFLPLRWSWSGAMGGEYNAVNLSINHSQAAEMLEIGIRQSSGAPEHFVN